MTQLLLVGKYFWFVCTVVWCSLIFYLSSQSQLPGPPVGWMDFIFKKTAHIGVYAFLYLFSFNLFSSDKRRRYKEAFLFSLLYATSDEIHQRFVPGRTSMARDVIFDAIGMSGMALQLKGKIV